MNERIIRPLTHDTTAEVIAASVHCSGSRTGDASRDRATCVPHRHRGPNGCIVLRVSAASNGGAMHDDVLTVARAALREKPADHVSLAANPRG